MNFFFNVYFQDRPHIHDAQSIYVQFHQNHKDWRKWFSFLSWRCIAWVFKPLSTKLSARAFHRATRPISTDDNHNLVFKTTRLEVQHLWSMCLQKLQTSQKVNPIHYIVVFLPMMKINCIPSRLSTRMGKIIIPISAGISANIIVCLALRKLEYGTENIQHGTLQLCLAHTYWPIPTAVQKRWWTIDKQLMFSISTNYLHFNFYILNFISCFTRCFIVVL